MIDINNKKVAIYGGSFNPIHIGHLITGFEIIEKLKYDYVLYIPANIPVHKDFVNAARPLDRLKMVELGIQENNEFIMSDIEIKRGGLTYTIDTVRELTKLYNYSNKFGVIIGDDLIEDLDTWKEIDTLQEITNLICLFRNDKKIFDTKYKVTWVKNRILEISSTEIRDRIKNCLSINYLVTDKVKDYIYKNNLYRE